MLGDWRAIYPGKEIDGFAQKIGISGGLRQTRIGQRGTSRLPRDHDSIQIDSKENRFLADGKMLHLSVS
jgi:hypothetical protein